MITVKIVYSRRGSMSWWVPGAVPARPAGQRQGVHPGTPAPVTVKGLCISKHSHKSNSKV